MDTILGFWLCGDRLQTIKLENLCDKNRYPDCKDKSDESDETCRSHKCVPGLWKCADDKCIDEEYVCDGFNLCDDNSDENIYLCEEWKCPKDTIKRSGMNFSALLFSFNSFHRQFVPISC